MTSTRWVHATEIQTCRANTQIATPANWKVGEDVIVRNDVKNDEAKQLFGDDVKAVYPYLRFTSDPSKKAANGQ